MCIGFNQKFKKFHHKSQEKKKENSQENPQWYNIKQSCKILYVQFKTSFIVCFVFHNFLYTTLKKKLFLT